MNPKKPARQNTIPAVGDEFFTKKRSDGTPMRRVVLSTRSCVDPHTNKNDTLIEMAPAGGSQGKRTSVFYRTFRPGGNYWPAAWGPDGIDPNPQPPRADGRSRPRHGRKGTAPADPKSVAEALRLVRDGATFKAAGDAVGLSDATVRRYHKDAEGSAATIDVLHGIDAKLGAILDVLSKPAGTTADEVVAKVVGPHLVHMQVNIPRGMSDDDFFAHAKAWLKSLRDEAPAS